jgi:hypothetical protein
MARHAVLARTGHSEITLITLPCPMTKESAKAYVDSQGIQKSMEGLRACVERAEQYEMRRIEGTDRVIRYDLTEMTEAEKARGREEHNARWRHLSHEDLV